MPAGFSCWQREHFMPDLRNAGPVKMEGSCEPSVGRGWDQGLSGGAAGDCPPLMASGVAGATLSSLPRPPTSGPPLARKGHPAMPELRDFRDRRGQGVTPPAETHEPDPRGSSSTGRRPSACRMSCSIWRRGSEAPSQAAPRVDQEACRSRHGPDPSRPRARPEGERDHDLHSEDEHQLRTEVDATASAACPQREPGRRRRRSSRPNP